ncbi:MAG: SRPBCC family protein [Nocardioides sp.]
MNARTVSGKTTVDAPPHVVFAIVADPRQHARIDGSGSVQQLVEGPERLTKGAEFGVAMKMFGLPYKISNRVVEFEEDRLIAWRHFGGHRWRYELEPTDDGGTVVTETFDYSRYNALWRGVITAAGFLGRNKRGIDETLVRLREAAESDAVRS